MGQDSQLEALRKIALTATCLDDFKPLYLRWKVLGYIPPARTNINTSRSVRAEAHEVKYLYSYEEPDGLTARTLLTRLQKLYRQDA